MPTTRPGPGRTAAAGDLRPALALARIDCLATLSADTAGVAARAAADPRRAADPAWWAAELATPGRRLDDGWARLAGPPQRRARVGTRSWRMVTGVPGLTPVRPRAGAIAVTDRPGPAVLAAAAAAVLPAPAALPRPARRPGRRAPGSGPAGAAAAGTAPRGASAERSSELPGRPPPGGGLLPVGLLLPGGLLSGSAVSGVVGVWRALPGSGVGTALVLAGVLLLAGAAVVAQVRAVRVARARALADRVGAAVTAAGERELLRRSLAAERAAGPAVGRPVGPAWRGADRAA